MKRPSFALLAGAAAFVLGQPVAAQHTMMPGMAMPGMKMPAPKKKAAPSKKKAAPKSTTSKKPAGRAPAKTPAAKKKTTAGKPRADQDMSTMPGMEMPAGHDMSTMPQPQAPAEHDMSTMPGMVMPGNEAGNMAAPAAPEGTDLPAGNAPPPPVPTVNAADAVYGADAMHMGRRHLQQFHGGQKLSHVLVNVAEAQIRKGRDGYEWDGEAWYGGDINRLWLKSEGDGTFGRSVDRAEVQALYSHAVDPYFNLQGGLRYDFKPNPSRVYATVGIEGLAPSFFEVEGALFLSNKGELMARAEGWYDQRITQRLILQPRAELNFAAQNSRSIGVGSGLSDAEIGVRLRYDIRREFAPYIGVQYRRAFGNTRRFLKEAGEEAGGWTLLTGVRVQF